MAARKPPDEIQQEHIYFHLQTGDQQVVPAVQLPQRQIKMTYLSPGEQVVPSIITTSGNSSGKQIVGSKLLEGHDNQSELSLDQSHDQLIQSNVKSSSQLVQRHQTVVTSVQTTCVSQQQIQSRTVMAQSGKHVQHQGQTWSQVATQKAQAKAETLELSLSQVALQKKQAKAEFMEQTAHGVQTRLSIDQGQVSQMSQRLQEQTHTSASAFSESKNTQVVEKSEAGEQKTITSSSSSSVIHSQSSSSKLNVDYKSQSFTLPHDVSHANVLEFFEEQDKQFKEQHSGTVLSRQKRSPSPSPVRQSVGLDHLDNLVKLMEQLSSLKDENGKLKKKCAYLESTKSLLEVKNALEQEIMEAQAARSSPSSPRIKRSRKSRNRLPSADNSAFEVEVDDAQSETGPHRPSPTVQHKRCYSTGSIDIPSEILETPVEEEHVQEVHSTSYDKGNKSVHHHKTNKSPVSKRKAKISSWAKFKKVITRPKLPEEISFSLKSIKKDFGRGSVSSPKELHVPTSNLENRSVDSGMGSGLEADPQEYVRKSTSSGEPSSPTHESRPRSDTREEIVTTDDDLGTEIWMGDPDWIEKHEDELLLDSINREIIVLNTNQTSESDQYLQVPLPRRKSSPSLLENGDSDKDQELIKDYLNLRRSSSYKGRSSHGDLDEINLTIPKSPKIGKKDFKATIGKKVKHIVHNRKDSIKKIVKRGGKAGYDSTDLETDGDEEIKKSHMYGLEYEGPLGRSTPKTSPMVIPRNKGSESPPSGLSRGRFLPKQGSLVDVEAILGEY